MACGGGGLSDSPAGPTDLTAVLALDVSDMVGERSLGGASAPITLIEYSSLTCPHCGNFHAETLPQIKANYIDTGKVRYIYRDFPLDSAATAAAQLARCAGSARYFEALELLFRTRTSWATSGYEAKLKTALAPLGLPGAQLDACLASTELQAVVLQNRQAGVSQGVTGTPTFFINGTPLVGAQPYDRFKALFDR
jgi:protein-disulfide isomerase